MHLKEKLAAWSAPCLSSFLAIALLLFTISLLVTRIIASYHHFTLLSNCSTRHYSYLQRVPSYSQFLINITDCPAVLQSFRHFELVSSSLAINYRALPEPVLIMLPCATKRRLGMQLHIP